MDGIARRVVVAGLACALLGAGGRVAAEEARPAWAADVEALRLEAVPAKRVERTWALLAKKPDLAALTAELARPLPWKAEAAKERIDWERDGGKGRLTVSAYVPQAYTPQKAWPVLLWLHGGVSRDEDGGGRSGLAMLREEAEAKGFLLLSPSGTKDVVWWSAAGQAYLRGCLQDLARTYRVDADRVAVAGFSDGGSGCFHLALHDPDPYACFLAFMGHPLVTATGGGPAFLGNGAARPVWAVNGAEDPLYPADRVMPLVDALAKGGMAIEWKPLPDAGHDPVYVGAALDDALAFWRKHPREPLPKVVDWECVVPAHDGRRAWVEVLEVSAAAPGVADLPSRPFEVAAAQPKPRLGISVDQRHEGEGIRVEAVQPDTPAAEAGFRPGDVLVKMGEKDVPQGPPGLLALRAYLDGLGDGEGAFTVKRGEETLTLKTKPRVIAADQPPPELGYGKPSGRVRAEVTAANRIEVKTRGVAALRLHLAHPLVDPRQTVVVVLNGKEAFRGVPPGDAAYVLDQALRGLPGDPLCEAQVTLRP